MWMSRTVEGQGATEAPTGFDTLTNDTAGTLANQVGEHLPDDYQAQLYVRLAQTSAAEATAEVVAAFPENHLVTILVGDASQIRVPVEALGLGEVTVIPAES